MMQSNGNKSVSNKTDNRSRSRNKNTAGTNTTANGASKSKALKPSQTHNRNKWRKGKQTDSQASATSKMSSGPNGNANLHKNAITSHGQASHHHNHHYQHRRPRPNKWRSSSYNSGDGTSVHVAESGVGAKRYHYQFDPTQWLEDPIQSSELTASLHDTLHKHGVFEHGAGSEKRLDVLNYLEELLDDWSASLLPASKAKGTKESVQANNSNPFHHTKVRLISFGSYRLGVHAPSADLDLLALCPPHVSRRAFFDTLVKKLVEDQRCHSVHPIPKAYTPVIKFYLDGIPIDLLFVRIDDGKKLGSNAAAVAAPAQDEKDENGCDSDSSSENRRTEFKIDDEMLRGLDEQSSRSLNGARVAQYLLEAIPNPKTFRLVLKTVKEWARVHGLYSNVLGFLGGVNWAILVVWVCQKNPEASAPSLLKVFFQTFSRWRWPKPVVINRIVKNPPQGVTPLPVWDPTIKPRDRAQIMPIITPCYPSMNSSYNVAQPQLRRLREELYRGDKIMNQIATGNGQWSDLLKENDFFKDHVHYLQVRITASNEEDHRAWFGLCESRLRILIASLDSIEHGTHAYPFSKFFKREANEISNPQEESHDIVTYFYIALRFADGVENVDLWGCTTEYAYSVDGWEGKREGMDLHIEHVLQQNLPDFVFETSSPSNKEPSESGKEKAKCDDCLDSLASPLKKTKITRS